jgi:hypothetical protein
MNFAAGHGSSPDQQEVVMMKNRNSRHRPDPLMLLAILVMLGAMMTSTASAGESFLSKPSFTDLEDGDITLAGAEQGGAAIHMSFMSPSVLHGNNPSDQVVINQSGTLPDVYLSLRLPW